MKPFYPSFFQHTRALMLGLMLLCLGSYSSWGQTIGNIQVIDNLFCKQAGGAPFKSGTVFYMITGTFGAGNTFTAQLIDITGNLVATLGSSTSPNVINFLISSSVPDGSNYRVRVVSSNPVVVSPLTPPTVTVANSSTTSTVFGTLTGSTTINSGQTTALTVSLTGGAPYLTIFSDNYGFSTTGSSLTRNVSPTTTTTYTLTGVWSGCQYGLGTGSATVTVVPTCTAPTPSISGTTTYCAGQTIALTASGGTTYSWAGPNAFSSTSAAISREANTANGGAYTVTAANGTCTVSTSVSVVVNAAPTPSISGNTNYCSGETIALTASGGTTYSWAGPNLFNSTLAAVSIPFASTAAGGIYSVTVANGTCTATSSVSVLIPAIPNILSISSNSPVCVGNSINLTVTSLGGTVYSWSGPNGFSTTGATPSITNATTTMSGAYTVTAANGTCTASISTSVSVSVCVPTCSVTAVISGTTAYCTGQTIALTASGGTTYSWAGPNAFSSTAATISREATTANGGAYTVTAANGTCTVSTSVSVAVNATPTPSISGTTTYCSGQTIALTASGGTTYSWAGPNLFNSTLAAVSIPFASTTAGGIYSVTVANGTCTATSSVSVLIPAIPNNLSISSNSPVCVGNSINLTVTSLGGTVYSWSGPNSFSTTGATPTINNATTTMSGNYSVTAANGSCTASISTSVSVSVCVPTCSVTAVISGATAYCTGQNIALTASGGTTYSWAGPNAFSSTAATISREATTANGGAYTVTAANGTCTVSTSVSVVVNAAPTPSISGNTVHACSGQVVNLTATGGFSAYSWASSGGTFTSTTNQATFNSLTAGTYQFTVTVTVSGGCIGTATSSVFVRAVPSATISNNSIICTGTGNTITFSSASGDEISGVFVNYRVNGQVFSANIVNGTASIETGDLTNTTTYELFRMGYLASVTCPTPISGQSATVTVRPNPTATISNNSIICTGTGNTITFSSPSGDEISGVFVNYRVNGQVFSANIVNGTASVETGNLTTTTIYELFRVGYSASVTCPTSITGQSATVTVRPNPTAAISGNTSVCVGGSTNLTITATPETRVNYTVNGGAWQQIDIGSTGVGTLSTGNLTATAIYNLTRVGYAASVTCPVTITGQSATVTVTSSATTLVGATQYCIGETINLSVVTGCGTPSSYSWSGPNGFTSRASSISIENARTTRSGRYQVQVVFPSGTISLSVSVTVLPLPDIKVQSNPPICAGKNIALTFTKVPLGSTAVWQGPLGFNSNSIAPVIESATTANEGTYSVTVTEGSCTASATTFVKVNPILSVSAAGNSPVCEGGTIRLSAISSATTGFSWRGPRAFLAASQNPTITNARTYNSGIYSVTLTAAGFCAATATAQVIVVPIPVVTITTSSGKTVLCTGSSLQLSASATDPSAIQWFRNNVSIPAAIGQTIAITSSGTYRAEITNTARCTGSNTVSITTTAPPAVTATNIVTGTTIKLTATPTGLRYSWSGPVAFTSTVRNPSITNATVANAGIYTIQGLMVSTGCTATATTSVVIGSPASRLASAEDLEALGIQLTIYPNPTHGKLVVEVQLNEAASVELDLFDMMGNGKHHWSDSAESTVHRVELDITTFAEGMYLLRAVSSNQKQAVAKIMKVN